MNSLPRFTPNELIPEDEVVLEAQGYEFTDEEVVELERVGDQAEADHIAGRLRSAQDFFAELEHRHRRAG